MATRELIINGQLVDLSDDTPIALTFQVNDLADIKDRQADFSNSIKVPKTANNKIAFGHADNIAFTQGVPYTKQVASYSERGVNVLPYAVAVLNSVKDVFEFNLISGIAGFTDLIKDKTLWDLGILRTVSGSVADVIAQQNSTYLPFRPIIDYGELDASTTIDVTKLRPAYFHRYVLASIESLTGYTFKGNILSNQLYLSEIIQFQDLESFQFLPKVSIKDFLKDWMQRYFLTPVVDNLQKTITFNSFDLLYTNLPSARDWTNKLTSAQGSLAFKLGIYGQKNSMLFSDDETVGVTYGEPTGIGYFNVSNLNLSTTYEAAKSIFAASLNVNKVGLIPITEILGDTARILYNLRYTKPSGTYTFTDGTTTLTSNVISTPYFSILGRPGMDYQSLINRNANGFLKLLSKVTVYSAEIVLSALDVKDFDHFIPIYDGNTGQNYYVNKIDGWREGKSCKVQLVRM